MARNLLSSFVRPDDRQGKARLYARHQQHASGIREVRVTVLDAPSVEPVESEDARLTLITQSTILLQQSFFPFLDLAAYSMLLVSACWTGSDHPQSITLCAPSAPCGTIEMLSGPHNCVQTLIHSTTHIDSWHGLRRPRASNGAQHPYFFQLLVPSHVVPLWTAVRMVDNASIEEHPPCHMHRQTQQPDPHRPSTKWHHHAHVELPTSVTQKLSPP